MSERAVVATVAPTLAAAWDGPLAPLAREYAARALGVELPALAAATSAITADDLRALKRADGEFKRFLRENGARVSPGLVERRDRSVFHVTLLYTVCYFAFLTLYMHQGSPDDLREVVGMLSAAEVGVLTYWVGSSFGSMTKNGLLARRP